MKHVRKFWLAAVPLVALIILLAMTALPAAAQGFIILISPDEGCLFIKDDQCFGLDGDTVHWPVPADVPVGDVTNCEPVTINTSTDGTVSLCGYIYNGSHYSGAVIIRLLAAETTPEVECILTENGVCFDSATVDWPVPAGATDVEGCVTTTIDTFTEGTELTCLYTYDGDLYGGAVLIKVITYDQLELEVIELHGLDVYNAGQEKSLHAKLDASGARLAAADYEGAAGPLEGFYNQVTAITLDEAVTPCFNSLPYIVEALRNLAAPAS